MKARFEYRDLQEGHGVYDSQTLLTVAIGITQPVAELLVELLNGCPAEKLDKMLAEFMA